MIKEMFIGRNPTHFHINPAVKAFIISESLLWPSWNLMAPILAIFAASKLPGGNIETAGFAYSIHLISRVIFELISGKYLAGSHTRKKISVIITGIIIVSIAYVGFAVASQIIHFFIAMAVAGIGFGIISPAKNSLFSTHLDKDKESWEWGITDASVFISIAFAAALGGMIANQYGFTPLFLLATAGNVLAIIPWLVYLHRKHTEYLKAQENQPK